jgi:hypothetical protein
MLSTLLLVLLLQAPIEVVDPQPLVIDDDPVPTVVYEEPPLVRVRAMTWAQTVIAADHDTDVMWGGRLSVTGPIAFGHANGHPPPVNLSVRLDISALPGEEFSFTAPESWSRSIEVDLGAGYRVGEIKFGSEHLRTSLWASARIATAVGGEVQTSFVRGFGGGIRIEEIWSGSFLEVTGGVQRGGLDTSLIPRVVIVGEASLTKARAIVLGGDISVFLTKESKFGQFVGLQGNHVDVFRLFLGVDIPQIIKDVIR